MCQSGRFYPSSTWALVRSTANSTLLDQKKAEMWWKMVDRPADVTRSDVSALFFEAPSGTYGRFQMAANGIIDGDELSAVDPFDLLLAEIPADDMVRDHQTDMMFPEISCGSDIEEHAAGNATDDDMVLFDD